MADPAHPETAQRGSSSRSEDAPEKGTVDVQYFSGDTISPPPPCFTREEEGRIWRKVDWWLMPILTLMYLASFMDRGNIGNAKLQGLVEQLRLVGTQYNIALTMFFIPYCLCECPANLVLKKFRPSRWLPGITVVWGIIMTTMGLVKNYPQLVIVRVLLGITEAGLSPGVAYYLSMWYPRHMLQFRYGIFYGGAAVAGAFSGLLAFAISFMSGTDGRLGWSWIFIIEGCATIAIGILASFVLVDFPVTARFLTLDERAFVIHKKKYDNSSVGEEEHFEVRHLVAALSDWQIWLHILIYMSIVGPIYGISLFLPSIINGFGFNSTLSQLLTVPPYVCAFILLMIFAVWSDRLKMRSPFILASLVLCAIGFAINISDAGIGVKYFGTFFCVMGSYAALPGVVCWLGNNLAGQYKRGVGMAVQIGVGNFSGIIASNIYRSQDAPHYALGHGVELMFVGIGFITVPTAILIYSRINKRRDKAMKQLRESGMKLDEDEIRKLGDRALDFRYTL